MKLIEIVNDDVKLLRRLLVDITKVLPWKFTEWKDDPDYEVRYFGEIPKTDCYLYVGLFSQERQKATGKLINVNGRVGHKYDNAIDDVLKKPEYHGKVLKGLFAGDCADV